MSSIARTVGLWDSKVQVDMMYNKDEKSTDEFFNERGLTRGDVGTKKYPVPWVRMDHMWNTLFL